MAAPVFQANGTPQGVGASAATVPWPAGHAVGDIALLYMESPTVAGLATAAGFVRIPDIPQTCTTNPTSLDVYWCRATSTSMASPVTNTFSNHGYAVITTFRGCIATGNPWDVTSGGIQDTLDDTLTITGDTTTLAECLVVFIAARSVDLATGPYFDEACTGVTSLTERFDLGTTTGNGGGVGLWTGEKATAGAYGPFTALINGTFSADAFISIALKPVTSAATGTIAATQDPNVAAFTGSVGIPGTLGATQADNVAAFTGSVAPPVSGTLSATQDDNTAALTGSVGLSGTLGATQDPNTASFTGTVANPVTGVLGATQDDNVAAFAGQTILGGNLTGLQDDNVANFVGIVANPVTGTLGAIQDDNTASFTGTVLAAITGILGAVQAPNVASFTGNILNPTAGIVVGVRSTVGQAGVRSEVSEGASSSVGGLLVRSEVR